MAYATSFCYSKKIKNTEQIYKLLSLCQGVHPKNFSSRGKIIKDPLHRLLQYKSPTPGGKFVPRQTPGVSRQTLIPGGYLSKFLRNKLDILICPYIQICRISDYYMPEHVISGKIHAKLYRVIRRTSEFGTFLLRSLAFYKSPILLEFSSNGGLALRGWGLFSTKRLILQIIFHNSCRKSLLYLRLSTAQVTVQVPLLYPPSLSQKFNIFVTDSGPRFLLYMGQMLLTTSISYQWRQVYPDDTTTKRTR